MMVSGTVALRLGSVMRSANAVSGQLTAATNYVKVPGFSAIIARTAEIEREMARLP